MEQNSTPLQLIKFLYKETSPRENSAIEKALKSNESLRAEFDALRAAFRQLPKVTFKPKDAALRNVINYSRLGLVG